MKKDAQSRLRAENEELRLRLEEAEQALEAIRTGQVESLIVETPDGPRIFSLEGATQSYRVLVESMNEGAATLREDGTVLYCNRRFAHLLGIPLQHVMGSALRGHVPERLRDTFDALFEGGRVESVRAELPLRNGEGDEIPVYWSISSIVDAGSRVLCVVATDLREQRRSEALVKAERAARESEQALQRAAAELRDADRRKDEFLGMLSHELRNPLAPIRNSIYILQQAAPGSEQARRAQDIIERQTDHLTRLVDDLLDVTRIARGKIELRRSRVDLREVIGRAADDFRWMMRDRGVRFDVVVADEQLWADADATRITQIVGNLLHNASKFTRNGDTVALSVAMNEGAAEIHVRDTGAGIEPALLPRIFESFVQGERTLARTDGGLGLGLALVKGLVELHGGTVRADSAGIGNGSHFTVRLPLATTAGPAASATPRRDRRNGECRVLVVDDNRDAAASLADLVTMFGCTADVAHDGPAAIEAARANPPSIVLCDLGLPGMSGYEVAQVLRASASPPIRLIAVSGYAQHEDVKRALDAGFEAHIAKPPDPAQIERLLAWARDEPLNYAPGPRG